jgi:hypothetical protein
MSESTLEKLKIEVRKKELESKAKIAKKNKMERKKTEPGLFN